MLEIYDIDGKLVEVIEDREPEYYDYKEITENPIVLDFSKCRYWLELHDMLKEKFGLPEYYGKNWDALWDLLDGCFTDRGYWEVHIKNYHTMPLDWQKSCKTMLQIFDDVHKNTPNVVFKFID
ncbi:MAG: hypothetical protein E7488_01995 [Ruminococcaceae bacterium]|nr:hypothetical protein [Oscillospiraceae bacterium]